MDATHLTFLLIAIGVVAFLYSSVGHAGASGYIAVMTLLGLAPATIRPTALVLNILVASIGSIQFWWAGHFRWRLFWPFALLSVPAAYLGGYLQLPVTILRILIGLVLLFSAVRLFFRRGDPQEVGPPVPLAAIGLGGHWTPLWPNGNRWRNISHPGAALFPMGPNREAAAVSAVFILVNSIAGLVGYFSANRSLPSLGLILAGGAVLGGAAGSHFGSRRFPTRTISLVLAIVLIIAGTKLILTR